MECATVPGGRRRQPRCYRFSALVLTFSADDFVGHARREQKRRPYALVLIRMIAVIRADSDFATLRITLARDMKWHRLVRSLSA